MQKAAEPLSRKRILQILSFAIAGALLFLSWLPDGSAWLPLDLGFFHFFNSRTTPGSAFTTLLGITNLRAYDAFAFGCLALLYFAYYRGETKENRRKMIAIGITMLLTAIVMKRLIVEIPITRPSPTLSLPGCNRITEVLTWPVMPKDAGASTFPSDHGCVLMIYCAFLWRYFGRKAFARSLVLFALFMAPRLMVGAHWFTDVAVGALSACLMVLPALLLTPASDRIADWIAKRIPMRFVL